MNVITFINRFHDDLVAILGERETKYVRGRIYRESDDDFVWVRRLIPRDRLTFRRRTELLQEICTRRYGELGVIASAEGFDAGIRCPNLNRRSQAFLGAVRFTFGQAFL